MKIIDKPMGSGLESLAEGDFIGATFIMPNRKWIARSKEILSRSVGFLGVDFFTFDDLMAELAMAQTRNQWRAAYGFRKRLEEGETAFASVRDMEKIRRLFQWCDDVYYLGLEEKDLPYSWREDCSTLLSAYEDAVIEADCITEGALFAEAMTAKVNPKRKYIVMGFSHYKERHRLLLEKLDAAAQVVEVNPFGEGNEPNDVALYQTVNGERALRHMVKKVASTLTENPAAKIGVVMNHEGDRAAMKAHLSSAKIPTAAYAYALGEEALHQLRLLWRRGEDAPSACAFLRGDLAEVEGAPALAAAIETLGVKDLSEIEENPLPYYFSKETKDLLMGHKALLRTWKQEKEGSWDDFARLTAEAAPSFGEAAATMLTDALDAAAGDYGRINGREFESILCAYLEKEAVYGVDILSLDEAYGGDYDLLLVASLDGKFIPAKKEDSLMNRAMAKSAMDVGLYVNFFQGEETTERLHYLMASSKKSLLYKVGSGEEAPIFTQMKEIYSAEDLDQWEGVYEKNWDLISEDDVFSEEGAEFMAQTLREKGLSPSALDSYLRCPFLYFAERVLKCAPEEEDGRPAMAKGTIYHEALALYFSKKLSKDGLANFVEGAYDEKMAPLRPEYLWAWEKKTMVRALLAAVESEEERLNDEKKNGAFRPAAFETSFTYPFKDVEIHGVIDRVDRNESGDEILIDYKSSGLPEYKHVAAHKVMQLALYALARRHMGNRPASLEYVSIENGKVSIMARDTTRAGKYSRLRNERIYDGEAFDDFLDEGEVALDRTLVAMKSGDFNDAPLSESVCSYCAYGDLCRREAADAT
ncbi:PD-(D/E)XK nuclease family protein [Peptoniphilus sp. EMRHCC_23]|uniref:PD-(D/E)XK nuclease family protein n=1 Tax=Peptoniphilus rachelemmaiella TaxID=2811779 RepID=UPI001C00079C|nr:PD-(D/E)XK nuclease family protein [Peptoniphilus rachelemmaiella]